MAKVPDLKNFFIIFFAAAVLSSYEPINYEGLAKVPDLKKNLLFFFKNSLSVAAWLLFANFKVINSKLRAKVPSRKNFFEKIWILANKNKNN